MNNGTAVRASEKLWIVSANSAIEPVTNTISTWTTAVANNTAKDTVTAWMPRWSLARASSMESAASWL